MSTHIQQETTKTIKDTQKNSDEKGKSGQKEDKKDADAKDAKQTNLLQRIAQGIIAIPGAVIDGATGGAKKGLGGIFSVLSFSELSIFSELCFAFSSCSTL